MGECLYSNFMQYDLIVIGGGPAGYVGAIRAAQAGEIRGVRGTRAGRGHLSELGFIPTKALLKTRKPT